jgi:hypothetical protein
MRFRRATVSACCWGRTSRARLYAALLRLQSILQDDIPIGGKGDDGRARSARGPDQRRPK